MKDNLPDAEINPETVFERTTDAVFAVDEDWQITYANDHALANVGRERSDVLGEVFWEAFPGTLGTQYEDQYRMAMAEQEPVTFEAYYPPEEMWTEEHVYPSDSGLTVYYHDITERKKREEKLEQDALILETIQDGVFLTNEAFEFIEVNHAYAEMCGYERKELIGASVTRVVPEQMLEESIELVSNILDGEQDVGVIEGELDAANGARVPIEARFIPITVHTGELQIVGVVRDISEQKAYEQTLTSLHRASRRLLDAGNTSEICDIIVETMTETLEFSGVAMYLYDDEENTLSPATYSDDVECYSGSLPTVDADPESSLIASVFSCGETTIYENITDSELMTNVDIPIQSGLFIPLDEQGILIIGDTESGVFDEESAELPEIFAATAEVALNRLEREEHVRTREQTIRTLHDATRDLMQAETRQEISQVAIHAATQILGLSSVGIFLWDEERGALKASALSADINERLDDLPVFKAGNSLAWEVFIDGEAKAYADVQSEDNRYNPESPLRSELIIPLGNHGVFLSGSTAVDEYDETDIESANLLAANIRATFDRASRESNLLEQEQQLQRQNQELHRLNQINTVIRNTHKALVQATSRSEIEQLVCDQLAGGELYEFAWFAVRDSDLGEIVPRAWSSQQAGFLDTILSRESGQTLPVEDALASEIPIVVETILSYTESTVWRKEALERGYQSAISIPVRYNSTIYGAVEVYAARPSVFTGGEYDVLVELCDTMGNTLNALERTEALLTGSSTELEFNIKDADGPLFNLAQELDCEIELDALVPSGESWLAYILVEGVEPTQLMAVANRYTSIDSIRHLRTKNNQELFGILVEEVPVLGSLAEHGATIASLSVKDNEGRIVVRLSQTVDVRNFVNTCLEILPAAEFIRRESADEVETSAVEQEMAAKMTDRQRQAIELAFKSGYFAWPREQTGEELAEMMGITPPTFHSHLRKGLHSLLKAMLE